MATTDQNVEVLRRAQILCTMLYAANHNVVFEADKALRTAAANLVAALGVEPAYMPEINLGFAQGSQLVNGAGSTTMDLRKANGSDWPGVPSITFWGTPVGPKGMYASNRTTESVIVAGQMTPVAAVQFNGVAQASAGTKMYANIANNVISLVNFVT